VDKLPVDLTTHPTGQPVEIEHFVYGPARQCSTFVASLPEGITARTIKGGLILRQALPRAADRIEVETMRVSRLATAHRLEYDGHGVAIGATVPVPPHRVPLQTRFTARTAIAPGRYFGFRLGEDRFGHARFLGEDGQGYLLIDFTLVTGDTLATADQVADAPRLYRQPLLDRQPLLVWHSAFDALPLSGAAGSGAAGDAGAFPLEVTFRVGCGWPDPDTIADVAQRLGMGPVQDDDDWQGLLARMDEQGIRMPGTDTFALMSARVTRTGALKLVHHPELHAKVAGSCLPMDGSAVWIDMIVPVLSGGVDRLAIRDRVL